jgi:tetratricopeptide (TPR) repeat protein
MDGHSMNAGDIMYISAGSSVTVALSARDKETIRRFYSEDLGESWLTLNNRGNEHTQKREFNAAADCYAKAMRLTDKPMVRSNYAALHFNWANAAAQEGDMKTADEHFKAAWDLQRDKPDGNYSMMLEGYAKFLRFQKRNAEALALEKLRKS